jgi:biopolymer transport protein ExbB/TolQ
MSAVPDPPPRSNTGEIIRETKGFFSWLFSLKPMEIIMFLFVLLMLFVCALLGHKDYTVGQQQMEMRNTELRHGAEREELIRMHCASERDKDRNESEKIRQFFATQSDLQRRHDAERDDKTRSVISMLVERIARLELALNKRD